MPRIGGQMRHKTYALPPEIKISARAMLHVMSDEVHVKLHVSVHFFSFFFAVSTVWILRSTKEFHSCPLFAY